MLVSIEPESLGTVRLLGCWPKHIFNGEVRTDEQKLNEQGIPCWTAKCKVINDDEEDPCVLRFEMASKKNPCEGIKRGEKITFDRVMMRWFTSYDGRRTFQSYTADGVSVVPR